jgi:hypothetical protein
MKKLFLLIAYTATTLLTAQTYTVDNKPNANADFSNLQTAIETVPAGSTLLVQGSATNYGSLTIEKRVIIKGTGYFLNENSFTQTNFSSSKTHTINLKAGSSGCIITGIESSGFRIYDGETNISFIKNRVKYIISAHSEPVVTNILILGNFIYGFYQWTNPGTSYSIRVGSGSVISGNICASSGIYGDNIVFTNNRAGSIRITNSNVNNNIFSGVNLPDVTSTSNTNSFQNNIYHHPTNSTTSSDSFDNILTGDDLFIDNTDSRYSSDGSYILKSGSPAIGAGINGVDCGIFYEVDGVDAGYKLSGIPDIPNIYEFNVPITGYSSSSGLQINIKVKSNN